MFFAELNPALFPLQPIIYNPDKLKKKQSYQVNVHNLSQVITAEK